METLLRGLSFQRSPREIFTLECLYKSRWNEIKVSCDRREPAKIPSSFFMNPSSPSKSSTTKEDMYIVLGIIPTLLPEASSSSSTPFSDFSLPLQQCVCVLLSKFPQVLLQHPGYNREKRSQEQQYLQKLISVSAPQQDLFFFLWSAQPQEQAEAAVKRISLRVS